MAQLRKPKRRNLSNASGFHYTAVADGEYMYYISPYVIHVPYIAIAGQSVHKQKKVVTRSQTEDKD